MQRQTRGARALCLDAHDLVISKYVAGRPKDDRFCGAALRHGLVRAEVLLARLADTEVDAEARASIAAKIARHAGA